MAFSVYDSATRGGDSNTFDLTVDFGGSNKLGIVCIGTDDDYAVSSIVKDPGGDPEYFVKKVDAVNSGWARAEIWVLSAPSDSMGATVRVTLGGSCDYWVLAMCANGCGYVDTETDENTGNSNQPNVTVAGGDLETADNIIDAVTSCDGNNSDLTINNQTANLGEAASGGGVPDVVGGAARSYIATGGIGFVPKWDNASSERWAMASIIIHEPVSGVNVSPDPAVSKAATVSPGVVCGDITVSPDPAIVACNTVSPTTILGSLTKQPDPAVSKGVTVSPGVILGGITIAPDPAVSAGLTTLAAVILGSVSIAPDPAVSKGVTVSPTVIEGAGGVIVTPDPAVSRGSTIAPGVVLGSISFAPDPAIVRAATITGGVVLGDILFTPDPAIVKATTIQPVVSLGSVIIPPNPAVAKGVTVSPDIILNSITFVPDPAVAKGVTISPFVIEGVLVFDLDISPVSLIMATAQVQELVHAPETNINVIYDTAGKLYLIIQTADGTNIVLPVADSTNLIM